MEFVRKVIVALALAFAVFAVTGCEPTNDFKVVDALKVGMTPQEAKAKILEYGFELKETSQRPAAGWPEDRENIVAAAWRAGREEVRSGKRVARVEYYPVTHGILGFGQLFLFYGEDDRLQHFYRHQIN